jgi:hypothetical protein
LAHSADDEVVFTTLVDKTFDPSGPVAIQEMRMDTNGETLFVGANLWVVAERRVSTVSSRGTPRIRSLIPLHFIAAAASRPCLRGDVDVAADVEPVLMIKIRRNRAAAGLMHSLGARPTVADLFDRDRLTEVLGPRMQRPLSIS